MNCERCGHPHTRDEWDQLFYDWKDFYVRKKGYDLQAAFLAANREMKKHGPRPSGEPKPPLWLRIGAMTIGEGGHLMAFWNWLNGKKTVIGVIIVAIPVIWNGVQPVLAAGGVSPEKIAAIGGAILAVVGVVHKVFKLFGVGLPEDTKPPQSILDGPDK